jgi:protein-tyrosine-phosphatase
MRTLILFVCNGNIHRSVIAEVCTRNQLIESGLEGSYEVVSRGIKGMMSTSLSKFPNIRLYPLQWRLAEPSLRDFGINVPRGKITTPISREDAERAAIIFAMDRDVLSDLPNALETQFPDLRYKMRLFREIADVPDCADEKTEAAFRNVTHMIHSTVRENWENLLAFASFKR